MTGAARAALLAVLLSLPLACGFSSAPADLTIAHDSEPQSLDPARMTGVAEGRIAAALFEGLTRLDPATLLPQPAAAESFVVSKDRREWRFTLRDGLRWSNGSPVTAEDFRWSWLRVLDPATGSAYAGLLFPIRGAKAFQSGQGPRDAVGIQVPDERTLVVTLDRPVPWFASLTAFFTLLPVPRPAVEAHGERWTRPEHIVTNGPFHLEDWRFYREILLRRSETYRGPGPARTERIRLLPVVDANTQLNLYWTGVVDIAFSVPSPVVDRLTGEMGLIRRNRMSTAFLRLNVRNPPLDRVNVRRALAQALDRWALTTRVTRGGETMAGTFVPLLLPGYREPEGWETFAEAETIPPLRLLLPENPDSAVVASVLAHQWKENLGLEVSLDIREWKVYLAARRRGDYDLVLSNWIGDYPDPTTFLDCFRSDDGNNQTGWRNAQYDRLLADAAAPRPGEGEAWEARRMETLARAEGLLLSEAPIIPLYHGALRYLVGPRVVGFESNIMGLVRFADLSVAEDAR